MKWVNLKDKEPNEWGKAQWRYSVDKMPTTSGAAHVGFRYGKEHDYEWLDESPSQDVQGLVDALDTIKAGSLTGLTRYDLNNIATQALNQFKQSQP